MKFAERLAAALEYAGMTQADLARAVDVSTAAVTQWKKADTRDLKAVNAVAVARALGVRIEWLITGRGPMLRRLRYSREAQRLAAFYDDASPEARRQIDEWVEYLQHRETKRPAPLAEVLKHPTNNN